MTTAEKTPATEPPAYSGRCVGSAYICHLCRGPHYYSECPSFRGDLVCFYSEFDANIYMMQHPRWEAATMGDVYAFLQTNLQLSEQHLRLAVGTVQTSGLPPHLPASSGCITPGVLVCVTLTEQARYLLAQTQNMALTNGDVDARRLYNDPSVIVEPSRRRQPLIPPGTAWSPQALFHYLQQQEQRDQQQKQQQSAPSRDTNDSSDSQRTIGHVNGADDDDDDDAVHDVQGFSLRMNPAKLKKKKKKSKPQALTPNMTKEEVNDDDDPFDIRLPRTIHVKYLPSNLSSLEMRKLFDEGGTIRKVRIVKDFYDSNYLFAFVEYAKVEDARKAIQKIHKRTLGSYHLAATFARSAIGGKLYQTDGNSRGKMCMFGVHDENDPAPFICHEGMVFIKDIQLRSKQQAEVQAHFSVEEKKQQPPVEVGSAAQETTEEGVTKKLTYLDRVKEGRGGADGKATTNGGPFQQPSSSNYSFSVVEDSSPALMMIQASCASYAINPSEALYFTTMDGIVRREQQLAAPCSFLLLNALVEQQQLTLLHVAMLLHHANPSDIAAATAICKLMLHPQASKRFDSLARHVTDEASKNRLNALVRGHLYMGLLFEGEYEKAREKKQQQHQSDDEENLPAGCYRCAFELSKKLLGPIARPTVETSRIWAMAKRGLLLTASYIPGAGSDAFIPLMLKGTVTISFW